MHVLSDSSDAPLSRRAVFRGTRCRHTYSETRPSGRCGLAFLHLRGEDHFVWTMEALTSEERPTKRIEDLREHRN